MVHQGLASTAPPSRICRGHEATPADVMLKDSHQYSQSLMRYYHGVRCESSVQLGWCKYAMASGAAASSVGSLYS
jgi:hypothetical protein